MTPIANGSARQQPSDQIDRTPATSLTTGTEGMASTDDNMELYKSIHADRNIDYLTIHVWPKNWGFFSDTGHRRHMPRIIKNTRSYIEKHAAVTRSLGKPMVIEEFGLPRDRQSFDPRCSGQPAAAVYDPAVYDSQRKHHGRQRHQRL